VKKNNENARCLLGLKTCLFIFTALCTLPKLRKSHVDELRGKVCFMWGPYAANRKLENKFREFWGSWYIAFVIYGFLSILVFVQNAYKSVCVPIRLRRTNHLSIFIQMVFNELCKIFSNFVMFMTVHPNRRIGNKMLIDDFSNLEKHNCSLLSFIIDFCGDHVLAIDLHSEIYI